MSVYFNVTLGRWQVTLPDGTRTYRYRLVMEEHIGRKLRTDEHVHHINGDPTDDRIENLQLLTASEHQKLHTPERVAKRAMLRAQSWGPNGEECCSDCGTSERPYVALGECGRCYFRNNQRRRDGRQPRQPATVLAYVCEECGSSFERSLKHGRGFRFCSRACASRESARRRWAARVAGNDAAIGKRAA